MAAENADTPGGIRIDPDRKKVEFFNSKFVTLCLEMLRKYSGVTVKHGTYFSIMGVRLDDPGIRPEEDDFMSEAERKAFNTSMGFSMPNMGAAIGGIAY